MNDCGPIVCATRSRRCINSATRSLSSKTGAGGVMRMFAGTGGSALSRTAKLAGPNTATSAHTDRKAKDTRIGFVFVIWVLLEATRLKLVDYGVPGGGCCRFLRGG